MQDLFCTGIQFNVFFNNYAEIRNYANRFEQSLKEIFPNGFVVFPAGPVPPIVPKFASPNDNSVEYALTVTGESANITRSNLSDETDIQKYLNEFKKYVDIFYNELLHVLPDKKILFCGVTLSLKYAPEADFDATQFIKQQFIKLNEIENLYDVSTRLTYVENNEFYVNIAISNIRNQKFRSDSIAIQMDINDRYRFNINKDSWSKENIQEDLFDLLLKEVDNKLTKLLVND